MYSVQKNSNTIVTKHLLWRKSRKMLILYYVWTVMYLKLLRLFTEYYYSLNVCEWGIFLPLPTQVQVSSSLQWRNAKSLWKVPTSRCSGLLNLPVYAESPVRICFSVIIICRYATHICNLDIQLHPAECELSSDCSVISFIIVVYSRALDRKFWPN